MRLPVLSEEQKEVERQKREEWHVVFAWFPVRCERSWVWLEKVERKAHWLPPGGSEPYWSASYEYRELT